MIEISFDRQFLHEVIFDTADSIGLVHLAGNNGMEVRSDFIFLIDWDLFSFEHKNFMSKCFGIMIEVVPGCSNWNMAWGTVYIAFQGRRICPVIHLHTVQWNTAEICMGSSLGYYFVHTAFQDLSEEKLYHIHLYLQYSQFTFVISVKSVIK